MKIQFLIILFFFGFSTLLFSGTLKGINCNKQSEIDDLLSWKKNSFDSIENIDEIHIDLNKDGNKDILICSRDECGNGGNCFWDVLIKKGKNYIHVGQITGSPEFLKSMTNNYSDIQCYWHDSANRWIKYLFKFDTCNYIIESMYDCSLDENTHEKCVKRDKK